MRFQHKNNWVELGKRWVTIKDIEKTPKDSTEAKIAFLPLKQNLTESRWKERVLPITKRYSRNKNIEKSII